MRQGKTISAALQHSIFVPSIGSGRFPAVIALHGRGADENDLASLLLALDLREVILITARAPLAFPYGGYVWYELKEEGVPEAETFKTSLDLLDKFVDEVKSGYDVSNTELILLGFSQGTVMAYATGLLRPDAFRGIVALSGYIPVKSGLPLKWNALKGFPMFVAHGSADSIIPVRFGREAAELLRQAGADLTYREYLTAHAITEEEIRDLKGWILKKLAK